MITAVSYSQDKRTAETKVADLLARFPANDVGYTDKLMGEMIALGDDGIKLICDQIIPAGTGDDTHARFAVESLSRFLSRKGKAIAERNFVGKNLHWLCHQSEGQWSERFLYETASDYRRRCNSVAAMEALSCRIKRSAIRLWQQYRHLVVRLAESSSGRIA